MATLLTKGNVATNPVSLGFIKPTAGTPLQVTNNYTDLAAFTCHKLIVLADPALTNGHFIFVLAQTTATAADTTNGLNIVAKLSAGQKYEFTAYGMNTVHPAEVWIDCTNTGDIAICAIEMAA